MRSRFLIPLAGLALLALPSPAAAVPQTVHATPSDVFRARSVAVRPGEAVTFVNDGGFHNVHWNDSGVPPMPSSPMEAPWPAQVSRTFSRSGKFRYYCEEHGAPTGNFGMIGYVYVNSAGLLPPTLTGVSTVRQEDAVHLRFTASRAGTVAATFSRKVGRNFVRFGVTTLTVRRGFNDKLVTRVAGRHLSEGIWRASLVLTDANHLRSDPRIVSFTLV